jgi:hypothetical protein
MIILKSCVGNLHGFSISVEGKEQRSLHYATILLDMAQSTKGMVVANSMEGVAPAQGQKKEKLLPGERL